MPETLLSPSSVKLFGRVVPSLSFSNDTNQIGNNNFLQEQLAVNVRIPISGTVVAKDPKIRAINNMAGLVPGMVISGAGIAANTYINTVDVGDSSITVQPAPTDPGDPVAIVATITPVIARIYAFSFEGAIFNLPKPSMFVVHGWGGLVVFNGGRTTLDMSGVIAREWEFSSSPTHDLRYWEYEKGDFSLRLDTEAGPFEQILLAAALRGGNVDVRSGMQVSGMQVSGMQVSGMQVGVNPNNRNGR